MLSNISKLKRKELTIANVVKSTKPMSLDTNHSIYLEMLFSSLDKYLANLMS